MKLRIIDHYSDWRGFWTDGARVIASRGYSLHELGTGYPRHLAQAVAPLWQRVVAASRPASQLLRLGLHNAWPLADGGIAAIAKGRILRGTNGGTILQTVHSLRQGNKPAFNGLCVTPSGLVAYGEYSLNPRRSSPVGVFISLDHGRTYRLAYEFPVGEVRHIHFIQWDPIDQCFWMGTGDRDDESRILRSSDGAHWELVGSGSQLWRSLGLAFREDAIFWGTDAGGPDAGTEQAWIIRLDRRSGQLQRLHPLQGPCHGTAMLRDGTIVVSTGCEGGQNERDGRAHLWASRDGERWEELGDWRKDPFPYILQAGVIHFPHGQEKSDRLFFTTLGLSGCGRCLHVAAIDN